MDEFMKYIPFLIPLVIIQFGVVAFAIIDIVKKKQTKNLNPLVWIVLSIALSSLCLGAILYFIIGRADAAVSDDKDDI